VTFQVLLRTNMAGPQSAQLWRELQHTHAIPPNASIDWWRAFCQETNILPQDFQLTAVYVHDIFTSVRHYSNQNDRIVCIPVTVRVIEAANLHTHVGTTPNLMRHVSGHHAPGLPVVTSVVFRETERILLTEDAEGTLFVPHSHCGDAYRLGKGYTQIERTRDDSVYENTHNAFIIGYKTGDLNCVFMKPGVL